MPWEKFDQWAWIAHGLVYYIAALVGSVFFTGLYTYGAITSLVTFNRWESLGSFLMCLIMGICCAAAAWILLSVIRELSGDISKFLACPTRA